MRETFYILHCFHARNIYCDILSSCQKLSLSAIQIATKLAEYMSFNVTYICDLECVKVFGWSLLFCVYVFSFKLHI